MTWRCSLPKGAFWERNQGMAVGGLRGDYQQLGVKEREKPSLSANSSLSSCSFFFSPSLSLISHTVPVLVSAVMLKAACCVFDCLCLREGLAGRAGCCEQSVGWRRLSLRLTFNRFVQQSVKLSYPHPHPQPHIPHFFYYLTASSNA